MSCTYPFNMTRSPAGTVCAGFTVDGMPVGAHLIQTRPRDQPTLRPRVLLADALVVAVEEHAKRRVVRLEVLPKDASVGGPASVIEIVRNEVKLEEQAAKSSVIEVPIDGNQIFGPRDESLVFADRIDNVPEEYRQVGTSILMENDKGQARSFLVTQVDDERLTVDGNNPLCGREVVFTLEILTVRDATNEETRAGGAIQTGAAVDPSLLKPV